MLKRDRQLLDLIQKCRESETESKDLNQVTTFKNETRCNSVSEAVNRSVWDKSLCHVEEKLLKTWSGSQTEFLVLSCHENCSFNEINLLSVLSVCVFAKGDTALLESMFSTAVQYQEHPGVGLPMNNLGVILSESRLYDKSEECFTIAKRCFECEQDHLRAAVATLNLAALHKVLGDYQKAEYFADFAADLCHDIAMITIKDDQLAERLLRRLADSLEEHGNMKKFHRILEIAGKFDISGANKFASADLIMWVMKIQHKYQSDENIEGEELEDLTSSLFVWMDKTDESWNAELIRSILIAADINQGIGHPKKADMLVEKLEDVVLMHHSYKNPSYGSLLYQIGHFKLDCAKFKEAEVTLKQAEKCLIQYFGTSYHAVALCRSLLGTCALAKNNIRDASDYLNAALIGFKKIDQCHPEAAQILLKCALLDDHQTAQNAMEEAMDIFLSSCGEVSLKTIGGYIQSAVILQRKNMQLCSAVEKVEKGIALYYSHLGVTCRFPDIMLSHSLLGVLLVYLGKSEEAEKCFVEVQRNASLCGDSCCMKTPVTINPEVMNLLFPVKTVDSRSRCLCLRAKVVSLVNLVCMKVGDERDMHLKALVNILKEHETESLEIQDFAGQSFFCSRQRVHSLERPIFCIFSWTPKPSPSQSSQVSDVGALHSDDNSDSDRIIISFTKMSPCVVFWRRASYIQELNESRNSDSTLCQSVGALFMQPNFRRVYEEGKDFVLHLELPTELVNKSSLCSQIDCLPLLVELSLAESHQETIEGDYLVSWSPSAIVESSVHVSYFSYKFSDKRAAEFAFDHLISNLGKELLLGKVQLVEISVAPASRNVAFFPFQELSSSFLSVVVDDISPVVFLKCHTQNKLESHCVCSLVQNVLLDVMESLCEVVQLTFETSVKLSCKGASLKSSNESPSSNSTMDVKPGAPCSNLSSETTQLLTYSNTCTRYFTVKLDRKQSEDILQNQDAHVRKSYLVSLEDVDLCLCLLDNLLSDRTMLPEVEAVTSYVGSSSFVSSCDSSVQLNHTHLFPSYDSASSLNSLPVSPSTFPECGPFEPNKSSSNLKENTLQLLPYQTKLTCTEQVPDDSSTPSTGALSVFAKQPSSQSYPEFLSPPFLGDNDEDVQSEVLLNFEDELVSMKKHCQDLREQVNRLEEQTKSLGELLKQSEAEKLELQAELGRRLFVEDKQRRSGKVQFLSRVSSTGEDTLCAASASPVAASADGKLLADSSQEPSLTLQTKLEISESLTECELKKMKFLARGKVSGFRLARIREGFELFEELESVGEYPLTFIGQLLEGIKRFDLLEKLGLPLSGIVRSDRSTEAGMVEQTNGSPENTGNSPEPLALRDSWDMEAERRDKEISTAVRTSHASTKISCNVQSLLGDEAKSKLEKKDFDCRMNGLVSSGGSSDETSNDMPSVLGTTGSSESSCSQNGLSAGQKQFCDSSGDSSMSDSSFNTNGTSSDSVFRSGLSTQTHSNGTSHDSSDSSSRLSSFPSHSAVAIAEIAGNSGCNTTSSEDEIVRKCQLLGNEDVSESGDAAVAGACAANSEDREKNSLDSCDGPVTPSNVRMTVLDSEVNSTDNSVDGHSKAQSSSDARNAPPLQQSLFDHDETVVNVSTDWERLGARPKQGRMQRQPPLPAGGVSSGSNTDWEHLGARPKLVQIQCQPPESVPQKIISPLSDGLTGDFIARHSQDSALHQSLYRDGPDLSLFNEAPLQGASFANSILNASESNAVRPFFNDCQVASGTYPCSRLGNNGIGLMGGCSYNSHLSSNRGLPMEPLPSHLESNNFSFRRSYSSVSGSNVANGHSSQSSFVNNAYGFLRAGPVSRQSYVQYDQHSHTSVYQLGSRNQLYTGFPQPNFAEDAAVGAVGFQVTGHALYSAQSCNGPATTPEKDIKQTSQLANLALPGQSSSFANSGHEPSVSRGNAVGIDVTNSDLQAPCSVPSYVHVTSGTVSTTTRLPSLVCSGSNTVTLSSDNISHLIASRVAPDGDEDNSLVPVSSSGNAGHENSSSSILNRDLVANSGEGTDNSLLALEQRVAQACALVERVLREREEREQFGREIERKEQMIREERERERREREEREIEEAERWPQHQEAITARSQWLCEHYQRHCRVRFPCCGQFYPCHRCHNNSHACDNQEAKACHATHLQCNHCQHEQEIDENSGTCGKCEGKMSAYFCSICKHFTSVDKNPYHCEKCGICRIHKDKSFHCDVCNVCLDKRLERNHKCRPDSGHDECCICLEDAFSGCQILPCSHKVHRECAIAMIQNGIRTCPICRHPLYSPSRR